MPLNKPPSGPEDQPIYTTISRFLNDLHRQEGRNISHVTVTVHGQESYFLPGHNVHRLDVTRQKGYATLTYQELTLEAPVDNTVMMIAMAPEAPR